MSIEVRNISYTYSSGTPFETKALKNISFEIKNGEFVGIMGHTGCGKSTLIQAIAGLISISDGSIVIDGNDINDKRYDRAELRRKLGLVFQYPEHQLFETTILKDVCFGPKNQGLSEAEAIVRAVQVSSCHAAGGP